MATYTLKFPGRCRRCGRRLPAGARVKWHHALGHECLDCALDKPARIVHTQNPEIGNQGGSDEQG